jgi:hypothetical protein
VVTVEQQRQGGRPLVAGKVIESFDFSGGCAVDKETEDLVDAERIVDGLRLVVGLAHHDHAGAFFGMEETFHSGYRGGLVLRHVLAVEIPGGEDLQDAGDDTSHDTELEKDVTIGVFAPLEYVERADGTLVPYCRTGGFLTRSDHSGKHPVQKHGSSEFVTPQFECAQHCEGLAACL